MVAKIVAVLSKQSFSIGLTNFKEGLKDNYQKWNKVVIEAVVAILKNKAAIVQVYSSDGDFEFPNINAKLSSQKHNGLTYFIASSDAWNEADIIDIISSMEFELSALWIQLVSNVDEDKIDPVKFFESVEKIIKGETEKSEFQCIGTVEDGQVIVWENPNWAEVEILLPKLREICSKQKLECAVINKRDEN